MAAFVSSMHASVNYSQVAVQSKAWERLTTQGCASSRAEWDAIHDGAMSACAAAFVNAEKTKSFAEMYMLKTAEKTLQNVRKLVILNSVRVAFNELANDVQLDDECFDWLVSMEPSPAMLKHMSDDEAFAFIVHYWNVQANALKV